MGNELTRLQEKTAVLIARDAVHPVPWLPRLPRTGVRDQPHSLDALSAVAERDATARSYLPFLYQVSDGVHIHWAAEWDKIYAVGPFVGQRRRKRKVPIVLVGNYRRPYRHLLELSRALVSAYLEFSILPDIHLIPRQLEQEMEAVENPWWLATEAVSIRWQIDA